MEEDPKEHNFDQRHDGPFEHDARPSVQLPRRSSNDVHSPDGARSLHNPTMSPMGRSSVQFERATSDTIQPPGRASTSMLRGREEFRSPPRASTQMSRISASGARPRESFDIRRDGPYGRPSLTMTRRKSSGTTLPIGSVAQQGGQQGGVPQSEKPADEQATGEPEAPSIETLQSSTDAAFEPEPPPLNYSLWPRKWSIIGFWSLILIDCIGMPIGLYFGLWYGTNLSPNIVFSIVTAALGGVSIIEYVLRFRRLVRKNSNCRPLGIDSKWYLDFFHWNFSLGWLIIMIELIVGTIPQFPPIRLLSMPVVSMMYAFGTELLLVDILRLFHVPAPVRISSVPKGAQLRPGIYSIIEDVCAVDGSGTVAFREALNKRYEASHMFRMMLRRVGLFWSTGAEGMAVILTIVIFTVVDGEIAYVIGWTVPFVWAGVWTLLTYLYVKRCLQQEKKAWAEEVALKASTV